MIMETLRLILNAILSVLLKFKVPIAIALMALAGWVFYRYNMNKVKVAQGQAQVYAEQKEEAIKEAKRAKTDALIAEDTASVLADKVVKSDKTVVELKKKVALLSNQPKPQVGDSVSQEHLDLDNAKDLLIDAQSQEISDLKTALEAQVDVSIKWRASSNGFENALALSEKQIAAQRIQIMGLKAAGPLREARGALWGGAAVYLAHALGVF